jgi:hypothetical protein
MALSSKEDRNAAATKAMSPQSEVGLEDLDKPPAWQAQAGAALNKMSAAGDGAARDLREISQRAKQDLTQGGPEAIDQQMPLLDMLALLEG